MDRIIQLGLDYGTSSSKMIFRDYDAPGGERSYVLQDDAGEFRFPSTVFYNEDTDDLYFGLNQWVCNRSGERIIRYESVKMRVAEEVKGDGTPYYFGDRIAFPKDLKSSDIALLTIWYLLSTAEEKIHSKLNKRTFQLTVTMGIPMSFYNDQDLKEIFLFIIQAAQWVYRNYKPLKAGQPLKRKEAIEILNAAKSIIKIKSLNTEDHIRSWLRTEAESALLWAYNSPNIGEGLFAKIDVGAGTTNASVFIIQSQYDNNSKRWLKSRIAFFSANSISLGMDAVGLAIQKDGLSENAAIDIRGNENKLIPEEYFKYDNIFGTYLNIYNSYQKAWQLSYKKYPNPNPWREMKIFVIGGGGLVNSLTEMLSLSPDKNWKHSADVWPALSINKLDVPGDLVLLKTGKKPLEGDLNFLLVAYGLSNNNLSVPHVLSPKDVQKVPPIVNKIRHIEDHDLIR